MMWTSLEEGSEAVTRPWKGSHEAVKDLGKAPAPLIHFLTHSVASSRNCFEHTHIDGEAARLRL